MAKTGRPTDYSIDVAATFCGYIAVGEPLRKACKHQGMPVPSTIYKWLMEHEEFSKQYAQAKEDAVEMYADEIIEIADDAKKDKIPVYEINDEGKKVLVGYKESRVAVRRAAVRMQARMWYTGKIKPRKYGNNLKVDSDNRISGSIDVNNKYEALTDAELAALAAEHLRRQEQANNGQ